MFEIICRVSNINYSDSLELLRPVFERCHIPISVGKVALFLMPDFQKQRLLISLVNKYNERILLILQDFVNKKDNILVFKNIRLSGAEENMIEIKLVIDDVNYESITEYVSPIIAGNLKSKKELSFLNELLSDTEIFGGVMSAALSAIPDEMRNTIVLSAAECYNDKITEALRNLLVNKGINVNINSVILKETE